MNSNFIKIFKDPRLFQIFILGIISGMPFSILGTSIVTWLKESNVPLEIITTFAIAKLSYSLKFAWSPIVDCFKVPFLSRFGHRKSWLMLCVLLNSLILFLMAKTSPDQSLSMLYILAISLGFVAATFDINVDAFRIDKFEKELQAVAAANAVLGYRIGMVIASSGALLLSAKTNSWPKTFNIFAILFGISGLFILTVKENKLVRDEFVSFSFDTIQKFVINPFKDFFSRELSLVILLALVSFKLGDAMLGSVSIPFYLELGYSKEQIGIVVKGFGLGATLLGTYVGAFVVYALGNFRGMIITGIAQSLTNSAFIWLNHQAGDLNALFVAISVENFAGGMGSAALVAYLSILCNKKYSASQYALLSSSATFFNDSVTMYGGTLAKNLGWDMYFALTVILGLPGILLLIYLHKKLKDIVPATAITVETEAQEK